MNLIHPSAIVSPNAELAENVQVGPFTIIEDNVKIGKNTIIGPHVCIYNGARIGENVKIFQGASVSNLPQDLKFKDGDSLFYIGNNTTIREFCTLHKGTDATGKSSIGENCLLMAYAHVAHDCQIGNNVILANAVQIGGHAILEDWVIVGGSTPIHQFSKVGKHSMIGGGLRIVNDVPPFVMANYMPLRFAGLNVLGLRRRGFSNEQIMTIKEAYRILYRDGLNYSQACEKLLNLYPENKDIQEIVSFVKNSDRGIIKGK